MSPYETAVKMYYREHDRWRHWTLFFFGLITGIFVLSKKDAGLIPDSVSCFVAALISGIWVAVALSIRATTKSWENVIKRIECNEEVRVFHAFHEELNKYDREEDLLKTVCVWKTETWRSVTINLARLGVVLSFMFIIIGISKSDWLVRIITLLLLLIVLFIFRKRLFYFIEKIVNF